MDFTACTDRFILQSLFSEFKRLRIVIHFGIFGIDIDLIEMLLAPYGERSNKAVHAVGCVGS